MVWARFFKKIVPIALAGMAALVMAMPMSASAGDWNHRGQAAHQAWLARHQNWFGGWHHSHATAPANVPAYGYTPRTYGYGPLAYGYAPRAAIPAAPAYGAAVPAYATPYAGGAYGAGYGPCTNLTRLQNVYRQDRATGHPLAANDVARQMRVAGNGCGGLASTAPVGGYAYGQNGSVFAPLMGRLLGVR
jgi:hypothetical protein